MSAFVCSDKHLNALVNAALTYNRETSGQCRANKGQELLEILHNENVRSVLFRYPDDKKEEYPTPRFKIDHMPQNPVTVLKLCRCYDYQACETDDYEKSQAYKLIDRIRTGAINRLPGYNEAPWDI